MKYKEKKFFESILKKSRKISKNKPTRFLYDNRNLITSDEKGNLTIFSIDKNKITTENKEYAKYKRYG